MNNNESRLPFSDRHDVVKTVCVWKDHACYRIEVIERAGKSKEHSYSTLLWVEQEHGPGRRILVRDVTFPWVHHESVQSALDQALESLAAKLTPRTGMEDIASSP